MNNNDFQLEHLSKFIYDFNQVAQGKPQKYQDELIQDIADLALDFKKDLDVTISPEYEIKLKRALVICEKIKQLGNITKEQLSSIEQIEKGCGIHLSKSQKTELPPFNFLFGCDLDARDDNGAIASEVSKAIENDISVVVTASIAKKIKEDYFLSECVEKIQEHSHVFREKNGNYLLILPKKDPKEEVDLYKFGFIASKFEKVEGDKIFQELIKTKETAIEDFLALFEKNTCSRRILLAGHGAPGVIGGLSLNKYRKFLNTINMLEFKCEYLDITSCHGGGENLLEHYVEGAIIEDTISPSFPIIVRSIADVPITVDDDHIKDVFTHFEELKKETLDTVTTMGKYAKPPKDYKPESYPQMLFPTKRSTSQFRPIPMKQNYLSYLTFTKMRALQIENKKEIIFDTGIIGFYPLVISLPINMTDKNPILLSMIPGNAHHFLAEIELQNSTLSSLFESTSEFNKKTGSHKAFFIKKLKDNKQEYNNVVICLTKKQRFYLSSRNESGTTVYEKITDSKTERITESEYNLEMSTIYHLTTPTEKALRFSSGGQEGEKDFLQNVKDTFPSLLSDYRINRDVALKAVQYDREIFKNLPENLKKDPDIILQAIETDGHVLDDLLPESWKIPELVLKIIQINALGMQYAAKELREDPEFGLKAVKRNGLAFQVAPDSLKNDKNVLLAAMESTPTMYLRASEALRKDKEVILFGLKKEPQILRKLSPESWKDSDIKAGALKAIEQNKVCFTYVPDYVKDKDFVEKALKINPSVKDYIQ